MNKEIDYIKLIPRERKLASIGEIVIHELSGGTFQLKAKSMYQVIRAFYGDRLIYSDHCSCEVVKKCNKVLPVILSNN